jgi:hypothetical protein
MTFSQRRLPHVYATGQPVFLTWRLRSSVGYPSARIAQTDEIAESQPSGPNAILALIGNPFGQEESYDHLVRHEGEFEKIASYIHENLCGRVW